MYCKIFDNFNFFEKLNYSCLSIGIMSIKHCLFDFFLSSNINGGAILFNFLNSSSYIENSLFKNCFSNLNGGAISIENSNFTFCQYNCFINCTALEGGQTLFSNTLDSGSHIFNCHSITYSSYYLIGKYRTVGLFYGFNMIFNENNLTNIKLNNWDAVDFRYTKNYTSLNCNFYLHLNNGLIENVSPNGLIKNSNFLNITEIGSSQGFFCCHNSNQIVENCIFKFNNFLKLYYVMYYSPIFINCQFFINSFTTSELNSEPTIVLFKYLNCNELILKNSLNFKIFKTFNFYLLNLIL